MARGIGGSVTSVSPAWEQTWREAIRIEALRIIEEEAGAAADKVHARIQELGAKLALQLSRTADVQTMGERIIVTISTKDLKPLLRMETADAKVARLEQELDAALKAQAHAAGVCSCGSPACSEVHCNCGGKDPSCPARR